MKTPIVMVHGAFCGGWAFDDFRSPFEAAGHPVLAPDLPGHGREPGERRVTGQSMSDYAKAVSGIVAAQRTAPILVGHSLGGLVAQMAAARSRVAGLILLASSSPWGVAGSTPEEAMSAFSLYALGPYWAQAVDPDYTSAAHYLFDRLPAEARRATFKRMVPESGRALWETLNWWLDPFATTLVGAQAVRAPVMAIAGGLDAIHPAATVRSTAQRLGGETQVFPQMSHWLVGEPGWEAVAASCLGWIGALAARDAA